MQSSYLPYWGFSDSEKFAQESIGQHPNVSRDNVLTVFAQLAALRMHARRALISLFDKTTQHVVAEATPDLSLRAADGRDQADALWLGVRRLPRKKVTMCYHAVKSFIEEGRGIFVANDLTSDDRFKNHPSVTGHPHNRFYVSVPVTSPDDYVIGSLAVLDDRPRDGVTEDQERLLKELSATVMDHLLCQRAMREEYREERMVRALGLFVKGKSDLNEWFDSGDARDKKYGGQMGLLNKRLEKRQVARSTREDSQGARDNKEGKDDKDDDAGQYQDNELSEARSKHRRGMHGSPVQRFKQGGEHEADEAGNDDKPDEKPRKKRPTLSPTTSQLQDSLAPTNVRSVVNRAASMIYQALDVEGAMFIDARCTPGGRQWDLPNLNLITLKLTTASNPRTVPAQRNRPHRYPTPSLVPIPTLRTTTRSPEVSCWVIIPRLLPRLESTWTIAITSPYQVISSTISSTSIPGVRSSTLRRMGPVP